MPASDTYPSRPQTGLYLITPPVIKDQESFVEQATRLLETGQLSALQIRVKTGQNNQADKAMSAFLANALQPIARANDSLLILNDEVELARELGVDGVHIGQGDMPVKEARALLPEEMLIGITCHNSRHLGMQAGEQGADYVAFGAFFPSQTKLVKYQADTELLSWWQELMELPCVAIGGITVDTASEIARAGADHIAVSHAVWQLSLIHI